LPEGTRNTWFRFLTAFTGGALACSLAAAAGHFLPFSMVGAVGFAGLSMALLLRFGPSLAHLSGERDRSNLIELTRRCYESAVRVAYSQRRSAQAVRGMLARTESLLGICNRLRSQLKHLQEASAPDAVGLGAVPSWQPDGAPHAQPQNTRQSVGPLLREVMSSVKEMAVVLREVDHNAKELITSTEETAYSMSRLDSFLQDMADRGRDLEASTDAANRVALEGTKVVEEMGRENEAIISTVNEAASAVEDLGRWSQEVGKIVEVIRDIADETNLLALNASIIAAQSGEHGKAFGVVAEEIRGLAERTSSSTKEISDLVKAVQKNVANVVNGMKKSLQRVERGELLARNAGTVLEKVFESFESSRGLAKQIATSTFEHKIDSSQVVRSLHKVTDIARRIQSHDYAGWTEAGGTVGMARALNALGGSAEGTVYLGGYAKGERSDKPDDLRELLSDLDSHLTAWIDSLQQTRDGLIVRLETLEQSAEIAAASLLEASVDNDFSEFAACWDIVGCDVDLRNSCPAYKAGNQRVFFTRDAACTQSGAGSKPVGTDNGSSELPAGAGDRVVHKIGSGK
jgi:methyl-accepting chemotaxis protein